MRTARNRRAAALAAGAIFVFSLVACAQTEERTVRLGVVATFGETGTRARFEPLANHFARSVPDVRFELAVYKSSDELIAAAASGTLEFALVSPSLIYELNTRAKAMPLATSIGLAPDGSPVRFLAGAVIVRSNNQSVTRLEDLKGRRIACTDSAALAGWLSVWRELNSLGLEPGKDLPPPVDLATVPAVLKEVLEGDVEAGVIPLGELEHAESSGAIQAGMLRVLPPPGGRPGITGGYQYSTRLYPGPAFVWMPSAGDLLAKEITRIALSVQPGSEAAEAAGLYSFVLPADYQTVRECMTELKIKPFAPKLPAVLLALDAYRWVVMIVLLGLTAIGFIFALRWRLLIRQLAASKRSLAAELDQRRLGELKLLYQSQLLDQTGDAIIATDTKGDVTFWNPAAAALFGVAEMEAMGRQLREILRLDSSDLRSLIGHEVTTQGEWNGELDLTIPSGSQLSVNASFRLLKAADGSVAGSVGSYRDITEARSVRRAIDRVTSEISTKTGQPFFETLVIELSHAIGARTCFIATVEISEGTPVSSTVALCDKGAIAEGITYHLEHTPCESVAAGELCLFPTGVRALFPLDALLAEMGVDSYIGVPLTSSSNKVLGLMVALNDSPLRRQDEALTIFKYFASRAASELERTAVEERLACSERQYRQLFNSLVSGFALCRIVDDTPGSIDYRYMMVNSAFATHTGVDANQAEGRTAREVFPYLGDRVYETMLGVARRREPAGFEEYYEHVGRWFETRAFPHDEPDTFAIIFNDITSRKEAENELRESERRFRVLLENVRLAALMLDASGRVSFANDFLLRTLTCEEEQVRGSDWFERFVSEADRFDAVRRFRMLVREGPDVSHHEYGVKTCPGASRTIVWDSTLLRDASGAVIGIASIGRDVTDVRRLKEQFEQAQRLESVGRLAGGVAHDFNNLLTVINGHAQLGLMRAAEADPLHANLAEILKAGEKAAGLTRQLLAFSRRQVLQLQPVDLNDRISRMASLMHRLLGRDIEIHTELEPGLHTVIADPVQIEQVLMNLAVNARDAMPDGGTLLVSTRNTEPAGSGPGLVPSVLLSFKDNGVGMDRATSARIFEPFFTTKEKGRGTGLGLSTVYGIVQQCGGSIEVSSEPGKGAEFRILLPAAEGAAPEQVPETEPSAAVGKGRILLVDDEAEVRDVTRQMLDYSGYDVVAVSSAIEAKQLLTERSFDLVLTDVVMAGQDGQKLAGELRSDYPQMRVILMSGHAEKLSDLRTTMGQGAAFIQKPFTRQSLLSAVRGALTGVGA